MLFPSKSEISLEIYGATIESRYTIQSQLSNNNTSEILASLQG